MPSHIASPDSNRIWLWLLHLWVISTSFNFSWTCSSTAASYFWEDLASLEPWYRRSKVEWFAFEQKTCWIATNMKLQQINEILITVSRERQELNDHVEAYTTFMNYFGFVLLRVLTLTCKISVTLSKSWLQCKAESIDLSSGSYSTSYFYHCRSRLRANCLFFAEWIKLAFSSQSGWTDTVQGPQLGAISHGPSAAGAKGVNDREFERDFRSLITSALFAVNRASRFFAIRPYPSTSALSLPSTFKLGSTSRCPLVQNHLRVCEGENHKLTNVPPTDPIHECSSTTCLRRFCSRGAA